MPRCADRLLHEEDGAGWLADDLRKEWQLGIDPIPNMTAVLEDRGIKVLVMPLSQRVSGLTSPFRWPLDPLQQ